MGKVREELLKWVETGHARILPPDREDGVGLQESKILKELIEGHPRLDDSETRIWIQRRNEKRLKDLISVV